ncbi:beta strand repeat-containing protein [Slackia isoflavoniconvertens]|uniref:beta strand repeat-containing protein n=1 Tax=Slackia isoflavoniconvertens TaxID=572010 RepID=UPI003FD8A852
MMLPTAAFAAENDAASSTSFSVEQEQPANQAGGVETGASASNDTLAAQPEAAGNTTDATASEEKSAPATTTEKAEATEDKAATPAAKTGKESNEAAVAEVNGTTYSSLQDAINAASRNATVKLLADTKENVTISTPYVTLDLNGYTLNGGTEKGKPALTVTARVTVKDSSEAKTGTIMREDTAENSGVSSHYVIDIQGSGWLTFESGNVTNNSGNESGKGASLVRVGDDSVAKYPGLNIKGGNFTQNNFIVIKVDSGDLFLNGGTLNSTDSYAIENWHRATVKGGTVNGAVATWTYSGGHNSDLAISGGTINGDVKSVTYDGAEGKTAKVSITGGVVNGTLNTFDYSTGTTSNDPTKATIEVTGGTFSTDPSRYLIEGSAATPNGDGSFGVAKAYLAQVGENSYYTMDEAFKAQTASGEAITLLRDYTTGSTFNSGTVARVVNLNGHTWTCTGTDANSAAFEINNPNASLTVKNGKVVSSQLVGLIPSAMGGTIKYDNSTLTFDGVEASTTATSGIETNGNNANDTVVLKDSTLNVPNGFGIYFPSSGTLAINNSTINAKTMGAQVCSGNLNVNAGSAITVSGDPVAKTEGNGAIQDGAAISIVNRAGYKGLGQIAITGGTFTAKDDNAAIKAYTWDSSTKQESAFDNSAKTVAVSGGTFSSAVSADLCAEGCTPIANTDGTHSVASGVAYVAGKGFDTLQAAIDAAQDGETVTLLADATEDVAINKSVTLDLHGKTLTNTNAGKATISVQGGTVTVKNGNVVGGTGYYNIEVTKDSNTNLTLADVIATAGNAGSAMIDNYGTLTVTSGTYTGGLDTVKNEPNAKLTITGGAFTLTKGTSKGFTGVVFNYGDLTISGGEFIQSDKSAPYGQAQVVHTDKSGNTAPSTVISGGTFKNLCTRSTAWTVRETNAANGATQVSGGAFNKSITEGYCADGFIPTKNADGTYGVKESYYVAQVGNKKYETLADAIRLAAKGKTITLLTDVEQNTQLTINKNITLDLNGKTIKNTQDIWGDNANAILSITNGAKVTITGNGTIDAKENDCYTINVVKGDLTIENGTFYGNVSVVQVEEGTLSVKGGTFDLHQKWEGSSKYLFNCIDDAYAGGSANVAISGGTFVGFDPSASPEGEGTSYLAPGYAPTDNGGGTYGVKLAEGAYLLQDYRSGDQASWTYPTQEGMAFAGWYKDASFTTPCAASDVEGAAYAKFVPITDLLKFKGGSLRMDKGVPSESTYLRFGYTKAIPEGTTYIENGWYYKRLSAPTSGDRRLVAYNNALNNDGTITSNLVFNGVAKNYYTANFTEKAFVKYMTVDGTTVEAVEDAYHSRSVSEVADAILAHPMASEAEKDYATSIKSAIQ